MSARKNNILRIAVAMTMGYCFFIFHTQSSAQFTQTIDLPQALLSHTAVIWQNKIYVAGGVSDTGGPRGTGGFLNNVYYCASINSDGTLGEWQIANNMPEFLGLGLHSSVVYNGKIYVLGGTNMFGPRNVVYYAQINEDGTIGTWQSATPMLNKLMAHSAAIYNNRVYITGGIIRSVGATSDVFWGEIQPDGTIGQWQATTPLPHRLFGHRSLVIGDRIFVIGGSGDQLLYTLDGFPPSGISADIYSAQIMADGSLGSWEKVSELPEPIHLFGLTATSKNIYILGGYNDNGISNAVYFAPILADGKIGDWQAIETLPIPLVSLASVSNENYIYALGGGTIYIDEPQSAIYFARIKTALKALVKIMPTTINKKSHGKWITAILSLPEGNEMDIDLDTVRITAINGEPISPIYIDSGWLKIMKLTNKIYENICGEDDCRDEDGKDGFGRLFGHKFRLLKFDRRKVQAVLPEGKVTIKIEGSLKDGRTFAGENTNWSIEPSKKFSRTLVSRTGRRISPHKMMVDIPAGAFPGNPDLILTMEAQDEISSDEKDKREKDKLSKGLKEISKPIEFGPHGVQFEKPITIGIPYDASKLTDGAKEENLKICHWNEKKSEWEELKSEVDIVEKIVKANVEHFSVYQVMLVSNSQSNPEPEFKLGEVYVFPNPVKGNNSPKIHIEATDGDGFYVKIYSVSGRIISEEKIPASPQILSDDGNGSSMGYEYEIKEKLTSGIYYYYLEVFKGGKVLKTSGKFAVVK